MVVLPVWRYGLPQTTRRRRWAQGRTAEWHHWSLPLESYRKKKKESNVKISCGYWRTGLLFKCYDWRTLHDLLRWDSLWRPMVSQSGARWRRVLGPIHFLNRIQFPVAHSKPILSHYILLYLGISGTRRNECVVMLPRNVAVKKKKKKEENILLYLVVDWTDTTQLSVNVIANLWLKIIVSAEH